MRPSQRRSCRLRSTSYRTRRVPALTGITTEFYKHFWYLIVAQYFAYINPVRQTELPAGKNSSVTAILYKEKGDVDDLKNYRFISLLNVDVKILTKTVTNQLKQVLPSVVHHTQTAVDGRKIDHTIHMLRDLIQLTNDQDMEAAFFFLDQEKAYDRVNHDFLCTPSVSATDSFTRFDSNVSTRLKVNGFLAGNVPLKRGVRQGLSPQSPSLCPHHRDVGSPTPEEPGHRRVPSGRREECQRTLR